MKKLKNPEVSVVVPTYNEEKDIGECIKTLLDQSYKNVEIIIVDDGSTDKTREIVKKFKKVKLIEESIRLAKSHEVMVFSSNATKGSNEIATPNEKIDGVNILRFPYKKIGGESFSKWDFEKKALEFKPDVIIAHSYRHPHTTKALNLKNKLKCKVFLVTHAPFERSNTRSLPGKISVFFYDKFIAPNTLNKFEKVIAITRWEIKHLLKLGLKKEKISYIPNGIPEEFFTQKKAAASNKILFLGRISSVKNIETLIKAFSLIKDKKTELEIVGPKERDYFNKLKMLVKSLNLGKKVIFSPPIFDIKQKIKKIDSANIFVLPSKIEGMPQSLIEAMARSRIVIAANNAASRDLIQNEKNGYLFQPGNPRDLAKKLDNSLNKKMKSNAKKSVEKFSWKEVIKDIEKLITS